MANVDSLLYQYLNNIEPGPVKVAIEHLYDIIRQTRERTGGDTDLVSSTASASSTNFYAGTYLQDQENLQFFQHEGNQENLSLFTTPEEESVIGETSAVGVNSTITPLSGGASFNASASGEQNDWPDVGVSCYADVAGTLYFDFSVNGTDWRTFPTAGFVVSAGVHEFHTAVKLSRYFRARFVNGSSAQSTFQLFTYYGRFRTPNAPLNQAYSLDADSTIVRPSWTWLDVSRGLASGIDVIEKFGRNASVGTTFAPICFGGNYRTPQSSAATTVRIKSGGNANDTAAGSGAREVTIVGLDENFADASEAVATAGASASSATTTTFTRIHRAYVSSSGTYATQSTGSHSGTITIENGAGGTDWLVIDATDFPKSQTEVGAYSVASGKTAYVKLRHVTVDTGKTIDVVFFHRGGIDETAAPYTAMRAQSVLSGVTGGEIQAFGESEVPLGPYVGPCDIGFMAKVSTGTASVAVEFEIFLVSE